jgi:hypothetical protein
MQWEGKTYDVFSPIRRQGSDEPILIGKAPLQSGTEALAAVQAAAKAVRLYSYVYFELMKVY